MIGKNLTAHRDAGYGLDVDIEHSRKSILSRVESLMLTAKHLERHLAKEGEPSWSQLTLGGGLSGAADAIERDVAELVAKIQIAEANPGEEED